ncbi:hypothetical protein FOCG_11030 [Fusarium oxysporum f. sp. radicis-lycopersici 26381]|uniref:Uncharacterized protein n=3 Tax=Fusarium oxysporum TaxID=5507 RepID=A0A0J9VBD9_FUSO4|nr:hypothetical protein FOXG_20059 [Fusarium oxysporum f. sp. lycopersici 4287]EWZ35070.1 hypothetical protein FOZG_12803 [Fusarium oxysporum Fo47]EWZ94839.1 hypothetical protein FOWG_04984 [Fusarium oxysporum f. sp. lycopersici MN25]EXK37713.1 hypothetical protein FOMG_08337 [Fusarium oxysporum f. sp. melonis 26406]EXL48785.1 hypothetical protein FOCG_11030 [Fusarium oxysporum f. sp. radicis-lycopersici 26381]KNB08749.1 hypothetical protein FOXG_20059 [Fusarium oxysporum f. sp. lycopersici 42
MFAFFKPVNGQREARSWQPHLNQARWFALPYEIQW